MNNNMNNNNNNMIMNNNMNNNNNMMMMNNNMNNNNMMMNNNNNMNNNMMMNNNNNMNNNNMMMMNNNMNNNLMMNNKDNNIIINSVGIISIQKLGMNGEYRWKIKILKTKNKEIMVGVAPDDFNNISLNCNNFGWYFYCKNATFCSGPPHNFYNKKTNLKIPKNEIIIIMNMDNKTLKFIIDNEDINDNNDSLYNNIPIEKPLVPSVFLYDENDSVQIIRC